MTCHVRRRGVRIGVASVVAPAFAPQKPGAGMEGGASKWATQFSKTETVRLELQRRPRGRVAPPLNSVLRFHIVNAPRPSRGVASLSDWEPFMSDVVQRSLRALIAEHGPGLLTRPDLCEQLLREAAPGHDEAVSLVTAALVDGVPGRLVPAFDAAALGREAAAFARRNDLRLDQAQWAVEVWLRALRPAPDSAPAPAVSPDDLAPQTTAASEPGAMTAARVWLGVRAGTGAGLLAGVAVALLCGCALLLCGGNADRLPIGLWSWTVLSVVAGAAVGTVAVALRLTERSELIGGMAGATAGLLGGLLYTPVAAAMPGCADPAVRQVSGAVLGVFVSVIVGGGLGVFQEVVLIFLLKAALYRRCSGLEVVLGIRRWNDEGLFDPNQQEWNRRAGR